MNLEFFHRNFYIVRPLHMLLHIRLIVELLIADVTEERFLSRVCIQVSS